MLAVAALGLLPLWTVHYLPNVDLPNHLLAVRYHSGLALDSRYGFLRADWVLSPFVLFYLAAIPLTKWVGLIAAAKIVISLYVLLLPVAFWFFLRGSGAHPALAFLLLPAVFSYHFEWGFVQYCIGVPITIAAILCSLRVLTDGLSILRGTIAIILIILTYLSHIDNFIALSLAVAVQSCAILVSNRGRLRQTLVGLVGRILAMFGPAAVMMLNYWVTLRSDPLYVAPTSRMFEYYSLYDQAAGLLRPFLSIDYPLEITWLALVALFVGLGFISGRIRMNARLEFLLALSYTLVALIIPRHSFLGSWEHGSRLVVYALICAFAALRVVRPIPLSVIIVPAVLCYAAIAGNRIVYYRDVDSRIDDIVSTMNRTVPPGSRVYTLYTAPFKAIPTALHAIGYYHLESGGVSPFLFTDHPPVNGLREIEPLPRYVEDTQGKAVDPEKLTEVLGRYNYLLITTLGEPLPPWLSQLPIKEIGSSRNCVVYAVVSISHESGRN
jgi:hypothetical protein